MLIVPTERYSKIIIMPSGNLEMTPAKMMREMPLPIPFAVICSPSHIKNAVPAVNVSAIRRTDPTPGYMIASLRPYAIPSAWINPRSTVPYRVVCVIFLRPSMPSFDHCSNFGTTTVKSCMMIDALMYGVILIAKMENLLSAPPEKRSKRPNKLPLAKSCSIAVGSTPGTGMCVPKRKMKNIISVKTILSFNSVILSMLDNAEST